MKKEKTKKAFMTNGCFNDLHKHYIANFMMDVNINEKLIICLFSNMKYLNDAL